MDQPNHPTKSSDSSNQSTFRKELLAAVRFTTPIWGVVLLVLLLWRLTHIGRSNEGSVLFVLACALLPFAYLAKMLARQNVGAPAKLVIFLAYYVGSSIAMSAVSYFTLVLLSGGG